jgi:3-oxoacyl-[acyl-carrier-protein] synthase-3
MGSKILHIEYYLPEKILTNNQLENMFSDYSIQKIEEKVGIKERHIVRDDETALDLAHRASEKVFKNTKPRLLSPHQRLYITGSIRTADRYRCVRL